MAFLDFDSEDIIHKISAKFVHAYLPDSKKPYYLKSVHQPDLDIHALAGKAEVYNINTDPKIIEEGFQAAMRLMRYLIADGYRIKTPLFTLRTRFPGEYDGTETHLTGEHHPEVRLQATAAFRKYIREKVNVEFDGIDQSEGLIGEVVDETTGQVDETITSGKLMTIRGYGLKIDSDEAHRGEVGLFFDNSEGPSRQAELVAVNEPKTIVAVVPANIPVGSHIRLRIETQSSAKGHSSLLKEVRRVLSEFTLLVQG